MFKSWKSIRFWFLFVLICLVVGGVSGSGLKDVSATGGREAGAVAQSSLAPLGQAGGIIYASEVQGNYAYVGVGPRLVVWDVSNPAQPNQVGQSDILLGVVRDVELAGGYAYVAVGEAGVHILDLSSPTAPSQVGAFTTYGEVVRLVVSGDYAYVASVFDAFRIFDVSDPAQPAEVGSYDGFRVAEGLDVAADYAYVATGGDGLQILDVSNPAAPTWQGTYGSTYARQVVVSGGYAYLADGYGSPNFVVVDVSNPAAPTMAGSYAAPGEGYDLMLDGSTVYLATWDNGIRFLDVSNPVSPNELGFYNTSGRAVGLAVAGGYVYVADSWDGFKVVDANDPANPALAHAYHSPGEAWDVAVSGDAAFLGDRNNGFYALDVATPATPTITGFYAQGWGSIGEIDMAATGPHLFVADHANVYVYDVSDPASPAEVSLYGALTEPMALSLAGDYAYVADGAGGLQVLDVSNPAALSPVGALDTGGSVSNVLVSGGYAYLADSAKGLLIVDVSDPASPAEVGYYVPGGVVGGIALVGHYAYVSTGWNGLHVINVSNPATPTEIGFYDQQISYNLAATEGYAYVIADQFGATLQRLDVSDPLSPTVSAEYDLPLDAQNMLIADGTLYVAAGGGGLMLFQTPQAVSLEEVRPNQGRADWANRVGVYGENLDAGARLDLVTQAPVSPTVPLSFTQLSPTHLEATIPAGLAPGGYDLRLVNPDGGQAALSDAYQVLGSDADVIYAYSDELWTGPTAPRVYQETQIGLVVHRAGGDAPLSDVSVAFYDGDPSAGGILLGTGTIASLAPDRFTSTTSVTWSPTSDGFHQIYAQMDSPAQLSLQRSVWVLPPDLDLTPPTVDNLAVSGGAVDVSSPNVSLSISASDEPGGSGVGWIYAIEFDWNPNLGEWVVVAESDWLDYTGTPMTLDWTLAWSPGAKNLVVWAADQAGNISLLGKVAWLNFVPPAISLNQGQFHMYCYWLDAGQTLAAQVTPVSGDPDLYVGNESGWLGYSLNVGTAVENVSVVAPTGGLYSVAVYGYITARYGLSVNPAVAQAGPPAGERPLGGDPLAPPVLPDGGSAPSQRALPPVPVVYQVYLPIVVR